MRNRDRLTDRLFEPIDAATLGVFRIGFGGLMVWETFRFWPRVSNEYLATKCPFRYDFFGWVPTLSEFGLNAVFTAMALSALFVAVGVLYRAAATTFFITYTYVFLIEQTLYNNHYYLTSLLALFFAVVNADAAYSIGGFFFRKASVIPFWNILIFRAQLVIVYFYAGMAKVNGDWLRGEPMRHMLRQRAADFPIEGAFTNEWVVYFFAYGGLIFDLSVGWLLLWRRTRSIAVVMLTMFHLSNNWMFTIGIFPWIGICSAVVFFDPAAPRKMFGRSTRASELTQCTIVLARRLITGMLVCFFALQVLIPLRHFLIPGNVSWTEEGHNFAWHMKLRSKDGLFRFYVDSPAGREAVDQSAYLTARQQEEISSEPRLLRKFAIFLREEYARHGIKDCHVSVEAISSLNGRPYQYLVDPSVNLPITNGNPFHHADWIVPLRQGQPIGDYPKSFEERIERLRRARSAFKERAKH